MPSFPMLCGSVASHPSRTGQAVHNAVYRKLGIDCSYVAFGTQAQPGEIAAAVRTLGIRGLAVTMPYKESILPFLDQLDPVAQRIGAINTIVNQDGMLTGYNVDWLGAMLAIETAGFSLRDRRVYLVGAGGAARAIAFGLQQRQAGSITIFTRNAERGRRLAADLKIELGNSAVPTDADCDFLIHATSAGHASQPGICLVPESSLQPHQVVMDVVPEPLDTPLILRAAARGCQVIRGYQMRLHQAAAQIELYTGRTPPLDLMETTLLAAMQSHP